MEHKVCILVQKIVSSRKEMGNGDNISNLYLIASLLGRAENGL